MELIDKMWKPSSPVRLLSVTALALTDAVETYEQTDLFTPQQPVENARRERLELAVDGIRKSTEAGPSPMGRRRTTCPLGCPRASGWRVFRRTVVFFMRSMWAVMGDSFSSRLRPAAGHR